MSGYRDIVNAGDIVKGFPLISTADQERLSLIRAKNLIQSDSDLL